MSSGLPWIVLAEDNTPDVFLIREALRLKGLNHRLEVVQDGDRMLNVIANIDADHGSSCPDLFVVDLNLPKRAGSEVIAHLRRAKRCSTVPVIVISSSDAPADRESARVLGAYAYFRKPAELNAFLQIADVIEAALTQGRSSAPPA